MNNFINRLIAIAAVLAFGLTTATPAGLTKSDAPNLSAGITTGTSASNAVTVTGQLAVITTEALTTAAGADYTLTITDTRVDAGCAAFFSVAQGSTAGGPYLVHNVVITDDQIVIKVRNLHATVAANGALTIYMLVL
jgi:hypothetical protein